MKGDTASGIATARYPTCATGGFAASNPCSGHDVSIRMGVGADVVTGIAFLVNSLTAKHLELLRELAPNARVIGFLEDPKDPIMLSDSKQAEERRHQAKRQLEQIDIAHVPLLSPRSQQGRPEGPGVNLFHGDKVLLNRTRSTAAIQ